MNRQAPKILIEHVLKRSSHHMAQRLGNIAYQIPNHVQKINEEAYIDNTLSKIYCDFLISNQYSHMQSRPTIVLQEAILSKSLYLLQLSKEEKENFQLQKNLIFIIKKLDDSNNLHTLYSKTEELISQITPQQANKCKKYLMYIYKWILNHNGRISPELEQLKLNLKETLIVKICEAHSKIQEQEQIKNQLHRLEILAKAREFIQKGDSEQAKINYQIVFENLQNNQAVRMQALEYLCKNSEEKGDLSYLLDMMIKIKHSDPQKIYMRYIQNSLSKLTKNSGDSSPKNSTQ